MRIIIIMQNMYLIKPGQKELIIDDLKIIFLVNKQNLGTWEKYKEIPHCFSDNIF